MSVNAVFFWQPGPGRQAEVLGTFATARKIHERLGARVFTRQPLFYGNQPPRLQYLMNFDDLAAYATFSGKLDADAEWQGFFVPLITAQNPVAALSQTVLAETIPGCDAALPAQNGQRIFLTSIWKPDPSRMDELIQTVLAAKPVIDASTGGILRASLIAVGGTDSGNLVVSTEFTDLGAYAKGSKKFQGDAAAQAFMATRVYQASPAATPVSTNLSRELPV